MLAHVIRRHWHAVQLDVLRMGFHRGDMFTGLSVDEMVSITTAAPPGTAVFHAINQGWTITDHLLATMGEHQAGLVNLPHRFARPGVTDLRPPRPPSMRDHTKPVVRTDFDVMSIADFEKRRRSKRGGKQKNG